MEQATTVITQDDPIAETLRAYAQNVLVVIFGILPIFFIPSSLAPFEYTKIVIVAVGVLSALVLYSLSALRAGGVQIGVSYTIVGVWTVALCGFIASLLSGDFKDSFLGDILSTQTTAFLILLALIMSVWVLVDAGKRAVMRLYMLLAASTIVLVLFHSIRLFFGADTLAFDVFTSTMSTPVGGWNDLALFLGLSTILSLVAVDQLPLTKWGRILFVIVTVFSLIMLGIINFFVVWIVLGLTSLAVIVYSLTKDRIPGSQLSLVQSKSFNTTSLFISLLVFLVSVIFVVGGSSLGGTVAKYTGITYLEVRPSLEATADIARNVYRDNAFIGTGPNKFIDAWRLYKDEAINTTTFWNTDFLAGNGYVTTFFITMGVLGIFAWVLFLGAFFVSGIRMLLTGADQDHKWYFIGLSSFVSAVYIWGMSIIYVPGAVMLMLGALCMGITVNAERVLTGRKSGAFSLITNRRTGFIFTLLVIAVIVGSVGGLYMVGKHYTAVQGGNAALIALQNGNRDAAVAEMERAFTHYQSDVYIRTIGEIQYLRLNEILNINEPTEAERTEYIQVIQRGVSAAEQAKNIDPLDPQNWMLLGNMYSSLMGSNIEGVYEKSRESFMRAKELNPKNPLVSLSLAVLEGRAGNLDAARAFAEEAVRQKPNFTDALYYLSQLDIATGNVEGAIQSTLSIITLEPQNPVRYFQLGMLEAARNNSGVAIKAFEEAVRLDESYANARYLLALAYDSEGRSEEAILQLEKVLELNPGNADVVGAIQTLRSEGTLLPANQSTAPVLTEETNVNAQNGTITSERNPDTSLVTPVNTVPDVTEETGQNP